MMKTIKKLCCFLIIAGLVGGGVWYRFFRADSVRYVYRTQSVTRGDIMATVSATGRLNAVEMIEVGTQVSGTIQEIYVDYNSAVKKGQLIALLDPDVLASQVEQAKASLTLAQAGVTSARASVTDSSRSWTRNKELWARNLIAKSELDTAETALTLARANLAESEARVVQAKAQLRQAETNLGYTRIVSPVDGVVISRQVDVGQTVAASLQTPTLFSIARDLTQMQIEASIDEADIGRIAEGQNAECKFDAWPKQVFDGTVTQIRLNPEIVSNVVTYTVVLKVENAEMKLKPGMTANVTIVTERRGDVLKIPAAALRFSPPVDAVPSEKPAAAGVASPLGMPRFPRGGSSQSRAGEQVVWLVEGGRLAGSVPVGDQGISDRTWVEIVNSQLKEGQELAISFSRETSASGAALAGMK
ncbi:MAG: efflux RND transporter periplasmic adaptor subunit [Synergistaceae bacterium]|jgi:HlyD family secretion protein|nr:efflux RND transporter periplasmic adaptor subunit [Synergistaceae bacterium]